MTTTSFSSAASCVPPWSAVSTSPAPGLSSPSTPPLLTARLTPRDVCTGSSTELASLTTGAGRADCPAGRAASRSLPRPGRRGRRPARRPGARRRAGRLGRATCPSRRCNGARLPECWAVCRPEAGAFHGVRSALGGWRGAAQHAEHEIGPPRTLCPETEDVRVAQEWLTPGRTCPVSRASLSGTVGSATSPAPEAGTRSAAGTPPRRSSARSPAHWSTHRLTRRVCCGRWLQHTSAPGPGPPYWRPAHPSPARTCLGGRAVHDVMALAHPAGRPARRGGPGGRDLGGHRSGRRGLVASRAGRSAPRRHDARRGADGGKQHGCGRVTALRQKGTFGEELQGPRDGAAVGGLRGATGYGGRGHLQLAPGLLAIPGRRCRTRARPARP